jgi:hypothetical protein
MLSPGSITNSVPDADEAVRLQRDTQRTAQENAASVAASFQSTVARLVFPETGVNYVNNIAVTTTPTVVVSITFYVPAGYTKAQVTAFSSAQAFNSQAAGDYIYTQTLINGVTGGEIYVFAPSNISAGLTAQGFSTLYGLTEGQTIKVDAKVRTNTGTWAASIANQFNVYASVLFLN